VAPPSNDFSHTPLIFRPSDSITPAYRWENSGVVRHICQSGPANLIS
jgi:hypothetical protein